MSRLMLDAHRALESEMQQALGDRGLGELRPSHASALLLVDRSGCRLSELARRSGVTRQAMMQMVDELADLGCLRRTPDPTDGRAKVVKLTAKGIRHRAEARRALAAVEGRYRRQLGDRRYDGLRAALEEMISIKE